MTIQTIENERSYLRNKISRLSDQANRDGWTGEQREEFNRLEREMHLLRDRMSGLKASAEAHAIRARRVDEFAIRFGLSLDEAWSMIARSRLQQAKELRSWLGGGN